MSTTTDALHPRPTSALKQRSSNASSRQPTPSHEMSTEQPPQPEGARDEDQPLLGEPATGDGAGRNNPAGIWRNLFTGTAGLAQAGVWVLTVYVWVCVLGTDVILFSAHPVSPPLSCQRRNLLRATEKEVEREV